MGWLHAVPRDTSRKGRPGNRESRLDSLLQKGGQPALPPVVVGADVLGMFLDVGPAASGVSGAVPISYTEIEAWARVTGIYLQPWQGKLLRDLSRTYVRSLTKGEDPQSAPPYVDLEKARQAEVSRRVGAVFSALARKGKKQ